MNEKFQLKIILKLEHLIEIFLNQKYSFKNDLLHLRLHFYVLLSF